jgi:hypothetical protein
MFIYSLYLHTSMHTFLVLLPTAHFAANACWRFYMQLRLLAAVYILHDHCCLCMAAVVCAFHMICLQYNYTVWAWQVIFVHGRWHVHVSCIMYMYLMYVHDRCWLCMNDVVYAWHMKHVRYNLWMYNVHGRCCLGITDDVCMTAVVSTWPQLPVHDSGCHSMAAPVCTWQKLCTICGLSIREVQSEFGLFVCPVRLCIVAAGQHWQNMAREISLSFLLSPVLQYM